MYNCKPDNTDNTCMDNSEEKVEEYLKGGMFVTLTNTQQFNSSGFGDKSI